MAVEGKQRLHDRSRHNAMFYAFANCELDPHGYELRRDGLPIPLRPKVFAVLLYLIRHRDRVVTRQELFDYLWPQQFVVDAALARCITAARKAIGDPGGTQQMIKTLYGRGYRFTAVVQERTSHPPPDEALTVSPLPQLASLPAQDHPSSPPMPERPGHSQAPLEEERKHVYVWQRSYNAMPSRAPLC
jgi:DNA-binding winged helix-turn-helix (wHTH) protein